MYIYVIVITIALTVGWQRACVASTRAIYRLCSAYIIKEGHVNLVSRLSPYDIKFDEETGEVLGLKTRPEHGAIPALGL